MLIGGVLADITRFMVDVIIGKDTGDIRASIVSAMWDDMQNFCKNSYEDNVHFDSIRTSKVGWKFIYNYIGALRLIACLPCFSCKEDVHFQRLIQAFENLLIAISRPFGPFWSNDQRVLCSTLYKQVLRTFHDSKIDKPIRNWSSDTSKKASKSKPKFNYEKFIQFCTTQYNKFPSKMSKLDVTNEKNLQWWQNKYSQYQQQQQELKRKKFIETKHRAPRVEKKNLPNAQSAIDTPNMAYGHQFFEVDLYEIGGGHLCNSMILESSLRFVFLCLII